MLFYKCINVQIHGMMSSTVQDFSFILDFHLNWIFVINSSHIAVIKDCHAKRASLLNKQTISKTTNVWNYSEQKCTWSTCTNKQQAFKWQNNDYIIPLFSGTALAIPSYSIFWLCNNCLFLCQSKPKDSWGCGSYLWGAATC